MTLLNEFSVIQNHSPCPRLHKGALEKYFSYIVCRSYVDTMKTIQRVILFIEILR